MSHAAPLTHKHISPCTPLVASLVLSPPLPSFRRTAVVAFSSEFVEVVNPMAMLLLLASFTTGKVKRVELYKPQKLYKTDDGNVLFRARGEYMYVCRFSHRLSFVIVASPSHPTRPNSPCTPLLTTFMVTNNKMTQVRLRPVLAAQRTVLLYGLAP